MLKSRSLLPIDLRMSTHWTFSENYEDVSEVFGPVLECCRAAIFNQTGDLVYKSPKTRHAYFRPKREESAVLPIMRGVWYAKKLKILAFGLLEHTIFLMIVDSACINPYIEDMTFTVTSCEDLSKTVERFSQSTSLLKYLRFKIKGKKIEIPVDGRYLIPPFLKKGEYLKDFTVIFSHRCSPLEVAFFREKRYWPYCQVFDGLLVNDDSCGYKLPEPDLNIDDQY